MPAVRSDEIKIDAKIFALLRFIGATELYFSHPKTKTAGFPPPP
jgi:hypothetical protein